MKRAEPGGSALLYSSPSFPPSLRPLSCGPPPRCHCRMALLILALPLVILPPPRCSPSSSSLFSLLLLLIVLPPPPPRCSPSSSSSSSFPLSSSSSSSFPLSSSSSSSFPLPSSASCRPSLLSLLLVVLPPPFLVISPLFLLLGVSPTFLRIMSRCRRFSSCRCRIPLGVVQPIWVSSNPSRCCRTRLLTVKAYHCCRNRLSQCRGVVSSWRQVREVSGWEDAWRK